DRGGPGGDGALRRPPAVRPAARARGAGARRGRGGGRSVKLTPKAAILSVVLMVLLLYMMVPLRSYLEQRARLTQLQQQGKALLQQQANLMHEIEQLQDPDYLQRIARECLGMVRPGEIAFVMVPKTEAADLPGC